jgi:hypothetical protein
MPVKNEGRPESLKIFRRRVERGLQAAVLGARIGLRLGFVAKVE